MLGQRVPEKKSSRDQLLPRKVVYEFHLSWDLGAAIMILSYDLDIASSMLIGDEKLPNLFIHSQK